jgi:hypothetical protein
VRSCVDPDDTYIRSMNDTTDDARFDTVAKIRPVWTAVLVPIGVTTGTCATATRNKVRVVDLAARLGALSVLHLRRISRQSVWSVARRPVG